MATLNALGIPDVNALGGQLTQQDIAARRAARRAAYSPITNPQGGLLASTVGTPLNPQPPMDPNSARIDPYRGENDNAATELTKITAQDTPYMAQARAAGLATANARGLLNTSMASGAAEGEALKAAAPLALQNSQNAASRNQARLQGTLTLAGQQAGIASQEKMQGQQIASAEKLSAADIASREQIVQQQIASQEAQLGRQLTAQETNQIRELATQQSMQAAQLGQQKELTLADLAQRERLTNAQIASQEAQLGRQLTATETNQIRELATQQVMQANQLAQQKDLTQQDIASRERTAQATIASEEARLGRQLTSQEQQQVKDLASRTELANLDAATRIRQQTLANLSDQQKSTLAYYLDSNKIYAQSLDSLYANKDMPAPARDAAIQSFLSLRNSGVDLPSIIFGQPINWGTGTGASSQPASLPPPPATTGGGAVVTPSPAVVPNPGGGPIMANPDASLSGGLLAPTTPASPFAAPPIANVGTGVAANSATMGYDPVTGQFTNVPDPSTLPVGVDPNSRFGLLGRTVQQ